MLKISPGDKDALHCKVVALVELSRFDDAIDVISSNDSDEDLAFEKVSMQDNDSRHTYGASMHHMNIVSAL